MKRMIAVILLCSLTVMPLFAGVGYAFFVYSDQTASAEAEATVSVANTLLNENEKNEYYRVYFFASPYYATGAEINGSTVNDPLEIANHENNPYNSDEEYFLIGSTINNANFANLQLSDGSNHYATYRKRNEAVAIGTQGAFDLFSKKDYTGYIRANSDLGITENTSTYVSLTVQGNLSMEQLNGIIASSEYRDNYGFGPEFIGWTYDKSAASERILFSNGARYTTGSQYLGDSAGNKINGTAYLLGNYGYQGEIEQITSATSLKAIDDSGDDGSAKGDKVIYLYPVFLAKNYSKPTSVGGKYTPIVKFRVNADTALQEGTSEYRYKYQQTAEIDYSVNRYTVGLFQRALDSEKTNVNYYIHNLYIGSNDTVQLDICSVGNGGWGGAWATILSDSALKSLNLPQGYYNVDMTLVYEFGTVSTDTALQNLKKIYESDNRYMLLYTSQDANGGSGSTVQYPLDDAGGTSMTAYYVIGFQRVEEFRLVGDDLNYSASSYTAHGYKTLYTITHLGDQVQYLVDRVYLSAGSQISVLIASEDGKNGETLSYRFSSFSQSTLDEINQTYGTGYRVIGTAATDDAAISLDQNQMTVDKSGNYTLIFSVFYQNGKPSEISVAYQENNNRYSLIVLAGKPSERYFTNVTALESSMVARCDARMRSALTLSSDVSAGPALSGTVDVSNIEKLFSHYSGKKMIDTATGEVLSYELFQNGTFCLNRDYVVYFE